MSHNLKGVETRAQVMENGYFSHATAFCLKVPESSLVVFFLMQDAYAAFRVQYQKSS